MLDLSGGPPDLDDPMLRSSRLGDDAKDDAVMRMKGRLTRSSLEELGGFSVTVLMHLLWLSFEAINSVCGVWWCVFVLAGRSELSNFYPLSDPNGTSK